MKLYFAIIQTLNKMTLFTVKILLLSYLIFEHMGATCESCNSVNDGNTIVVHPDGINFL